MKIAVLGFAHGHVNSYCVRWRDNPDMDIQVVKGWDHDQTRITAAAQAYGLTPCADVEEILADQDIKAVVIASERRTMPNWPSLPPMPARQSSSRSPWP